MTIIAILWFCFIFHIFVLSFIVSAHLDMLFVPRHVWGEGLILTDLHSFIIRGRRHIPKCWLNVHWTFSGGVGEAVRRSQVLDIFVGLFGEKLTKLVHLFNEN